jgi:hypothetical protein
MLMRTKFFIEITERETKKILRYTSFEKPIDDTYSVSFTDRDNLFRNFPKELYIIKIEEMVF